MTGIRRLRVFLCHASQDKPAVRELYKRLAAEKWIDPWLDEEKILPGQDWNHEIEKAIRSADAILICLSIKSVSKEGYVQKEIKGALDIAAEIPDGTIFIVPLRLEECEVPTPLSKWQWVDLFTPNVHEKLIKSLRLRAGALNIETSENVVEAALQPKAPVAKDDDLDLYRFIKIDLGSHAPVPYPYWIAKYPVTNSQYERFLKADDFAKEEYWLDFPKYNENYKLTGVWKDEGLNWLKEQLKDYTYFPHDQWKIEPRLWGNEQFGITQPHNPVVGINWFEANAYCRWLASHWNDLPESHVNSGLEKFQIRLPLETEWKIAAGGDLPEARYPWDKPGKATTDINEIIKRANVAQNIGHTTPVNQYREGTSFYGVMDMAGNIWEWQMNFRNMKEGWLGLRGGSWSYNRASARVSIRLGNLPDGRLNDLGFRVAVTLSNG
jgi:formylglycine-generating enzyme required for sulfatase activity